MLATIVELIVQFLTFCRQLERLCVEKPKSRVVLVTFSNEVVIWGDGCQASVTLVGDKLHDFERLLDEGKELVSKMKLKPIEECKE